MKRFIPSLIILLGTVGVWGAYKAIDPSAAQRPPKISPEVEARVRAELAQEELFNNVSLKNTVWHKGGFGTVMTATFRLHNGNDVKVKDIEVTCNQYGPSGTLIGTTTRTIYRALPPKADTTVQDFNMGFIHVQSATAGCKVTNIARS
jgi:hypothetical protein